MLQQSQVRLSRCYEFYQILFSEDYPLSANITKWSNTLKQFVFDHFVRLTLKRLNKILMGLQKTKKEHMTRIGIYIFQHFTFSAFSAIISFRLPGIVQIYCLSIIKRVQTRPFYQKIIEDVNCCYFFNNLKNIEYRQYRNKHLLFFQTNLLN